MVHLALNSIHTYTLLNSKLLLRKQILKKPTKTFKLSLSLKRQLRQYL